VASWARFSNETTGSFSNTGFSVYEICF